MRTIIVGDIHGCYKELKQLLRDASFNSKNDCIVSLGDLMDRGNESYDVLRFFQELKEVMEDRCTIIRGNHEQLLINAAASADVGADGIIRRAPVQPAPSRRPYTALWSARKRPSKSEISREAAGTCTGSAERQGWR